jgi:hypothetical protein
MFAKTMGPMTNGTASSASSLFSETSAISMPVTMDDFQNIPTPPWQTSRPPTVYASSIYANFNRPATFSRWR